jgi:hypothetical protein
MSKYLSDALHNIVGGGGGNVLFPVLFNSV